MESAATDTVAPGTLQSSERFLQTQIDDFEILCQLPAEDGRIFRPAAKTQPATGQGGESLREGMHPGHATLPDPFHAGGLVDASLDQGRGIPVGAHRASRSARTASAIAARGTSGVRRIVNPFLRAVFTTGTSAGFNRRNVTRSAS